MSKDLFIKMFRESIYEDINSSISYCGNIKLRKSVELEECSDWYKFFIFF